MDKLKYHIGSLFVILAFIIIALSSKGIGEFLFGDAWPVDSVNCDWLTPPQDVSIDILIETNTSTPWVPVPGITVNGYISHSKIVEHPTINFTCVRQAQGVSTFSGITNNSGQLLISSPTYTKTSKYDGVLIKVTTVQNDDYLSVKEIRKTLLDRTFGPADFI